MDDLMHTGIPIMDGLICGWMEEGHSTVDWMEGWMDGCVGSWRR